MEWRISKVLRNTPQHHQWSAILLLALLYFGVGQLSLSLAASNNIVTPVIFMAEGVALAALILRGKHLWPGVFLGQLALALFNGLPWLPALGISVINSTEAVLGALLFARFGIHTGYDRIRDVGYLLGLIVLVLQPFSATLGNLALWQAGILDRSHFADSWVAWWLGNSLGQIIVTPLILSLHGARSALRASLLKEWQPLILLTLMCILLWRSPNFYGANVGSALAPPLVALLAARWGMRITTVGLTALVMICLLAAKTGASLFVLSLDNSFFTLDIYLLSLALIGQFVAALFAERQHAEQAMALSYERLNEAQRIAKTGSWTLDLRSNRLDWSDEVFRIFEIDPHHSAASYEGFLAAIHPDDRAMVNSAYQASLANRTPYALIHRLLFPDGRTKYVQERCETHFDENGAPLISHGTIFDVTAIKQAEELLHIYATVFLHSRDAIVITDRNNNIIEVNPAFTALTGYSINEVRNKNPRILASGLTPPETYAALWQALQTHGVWQGELWDRRKDGSVYPKWATISAIHDATGAIANYMGSFVDITERKQAEERMQRLAHHDALTGLSNRFSLESRLEQALLAAHRESLRLAVMFIDMDRFKNINDTHGHHVGDLLLIEVASRLQNIVRSSDIVARLGGDEFVVILTGNPDEASVTHIAEKIVEHLGQPYLLDGVELNSSPSVGVSLYPDQGEDAKQLMKHADAAMYCAKKDGRNCFRLCSDALSREAGETLTSD